MALGTGECAVILVERKAGHGRMVEPQILPLPTFGAVAFDAIGAQHSFMGVLGLVTSFAVVIGRLGWAQLADRGSVMTGNAFSREVLAAQILVSNLNLEDMINARVSLWPQIGCMARETVGAVLLRVLDLVAAGAVGGQALELAGGERATRGIGLVAFDAIDRGMLAGKDEFCIAVMVELELADGPGGWRGMTPGTRGCQLASMRVLVTIRAFRLEANEAREAKMFARGGGRMALGAGHGGVLANEWELRSLVVDKRKVVSFPAGRGMAGGTLGGELFSVGLAVTADTLSGYAFEGGRGQGSAGNLWLVALKAGDSLMLVKQLKVGIRVMDELELIAGPSRRRVASLAGASELGGVGVTMARGAGIVFQAGEIDAWHVGRALLLVAFVTGDLGMLSVPLEIGDAMVELLPGQDHEGGGAGRMLLVARPAFPFESAVIAHEGGSALLYVGMALLALGAGNLTIVGMALRAGLGGFCQAMPRG